MTDDDIADAARRQGLERALVLFPDEVAAAILLANEQAALIAMMLPIEQAP